MVTILPIDVNHDLVREGLSYAIAERLSSALANIQKQVAELREGGFVDRERWSRSFAILDEIRAEMEPVLEYAKAFEDQQPADDDA
jgi:hypothetical protein